MAKQDFNFRQMLYLVTRRDYETYFKVSGGRKERNEKKKAMLHEVMDSFDPNGHCFSTFRVSMVKSNKIYSLNKKTSDINSLLLDDFLIRKLCKNISKVYGIKQANRARIIKNIIEILGNNKDVFFFKADIESFYESIEREEIFKKILDSSVLSLNSKIILKQLFKDISVCCPKGLPRGLGISAVLSELYMKEFDKKIMKFPGVFYYARYVDDIIIFMLNEPDEVFREKLNDILPKNIRLNELKTADKMPFDFLGYNFSKASKNGNELKITISEKKLKKIKEKLIKSFVEFVKTRDEKLLVDRLLFLTANFPVFGSKQLTTNYDRRGCLHGGNAYNYALINDLSCLKSLDSFLYNILFLPSFSRINSTFSATLKTQLRKYSFYTGYKRRIFRKFDRNRINEIVRKWN